MTTRADLYRLIDALPDDATDAAARLLQELRDPVLRSLLTAPPDDEPATPEEDAGADAARAEYRAGKWRTLADVRADLARRRG